MSILTETHCLQMQHGLCAGVAHVLLVPHARCTFADSLRLVHPGTLSAATLRRVFLQTYVFVPSGRLRLKSVMVLTCIQEYMSCLHRHPAIASRGHCPADTYTQVFETHAIDNSAFSECFFELLYCFLFDCSTQSVVNLGTQSPRQVIQSFPWALVTEALL